MEQPKAMPDGFGRKAIMQARGDEPLNLVSAHA
jgi:hypothetical protein